MHTITITLPRTAFLPRKISKFQYMRIFICLLDFGYACAYYSWMKKKYLFLKGAILIIDWIQKSTSIFLFISITNFNQFKFKKKHILKHTQIHWKIRMYCFIWSHPSSRSQKLPPAKIWHLYIQYNIYCTFVHPIPVSVVTQVKETI